MIDTLYGYHEGMDTKQRPATEAARTRHEAPDSDAIGAEATYLDLDGDGVPDAVQTVEAVAVDRTGDGVPDEVVMHEEVASEIGVDGVPERVSVTESVTVELPDVASN